MLDLAHIWKGTKAGGVSEGGANCWLMCVVPDHISASSDITKVHTFQKKWKVVNEVQDGLFFIPEEFTESHYSLKKKHY